MGIKARGEGSFLFTAGQPNPWACNSKPDQSKQLRAQPGSPLPPSQLWHLFPRRLGVCSDSWDPRGQRPRPRMLKVGLGTRWVSCLRLLCRSALVSNPAKILASNFQVPFCCVPCLKSDVRDPSSSEHRAKD